jgi:5-formyltetrahydrofolate cyclo-ligase
MAVSPTREEIDEEKTALRVLARERREEFHARDGLGAAFKLRDKFLARVPFGVGALVSGYWPFGAELDPRPLLEALHRRGHPLALPVAERRATPLIFRCWKPGDPMSQHRFGMSEPLPESPRVDPDVILVPMIAFDGQGNRLGYGGGFYDRTLAAQRKIKKTLAVGVAFDAQRVERIPVDIHDQKLDWIVTESMALETRTGAKKNWWWPW